MNTSVQRSALAQAPNTAGTFLRGFRSGALNSSLMLGIFSAVTMAVTASLTLPLGLSVMGITVLTTGIFSGVMGVKKSTESKGAGHEVAAPRAQTRAPAPSPALSQAVEMEQAPALETRTDWADRTRRSTDAPSRVQQILANGSLSDKDRASAILAERAQAANTGASIS